MSQQDDSYEKVAKDLRATVKAINDILSILDANSRLVLGIFCEGLSATATRLEAIAAQRPQPVDDGCICKGNWRLILKETRHLIGRVFTGEIDDSAHTYFGLVDGQDDYYYGMIQHGTGKLRLLSCVGSFETHGYTVVPPPPEVKG